MKFLSYINGDFVDKITHIKIFSPENKKELGSIPVLNKEDIDLAYAVAKKAAKDWAHFSPQTRTKYILQFAAILKQNILPLATILSSEIAKPLKDAIVEVERSIEYTIETVHSYLDLIEKPLIFSANNQLNFPKEKAAVYLPVPYGVALTISPFNYPINLAITKIIPALIVGNTVVHKSASQGSLCGAYLAQLFHKVKLPDGNLLPPGVFNYVTGKGSVIGDYLYQHESCDVVSFTGSTQIGLNIAKHMCMKPYSLEMGGNDAAIVVKDANLELAAKKICKGAFDFSGQRCTAIKRVYIDRKIADKFFEYFVPLVKELTVGNANDNTNITSVINEKKVKEVLEYYQEAIKLGAISLTGDIKIDNQLIHPVVLSDVPYNACIVNKEQFAPIIPFCVFDDINEVIEQHNKCQYGLQASLFTENIQFAKNLAEKLEVATVNINSASCRGPDVLPFTGFKKSGFNYQGIIESIKFFSRLKGLIYNSIS